MTTPERNRKESSTTYLNNGKENRGAAHGENLLNSQRDKIALLKTA
jgi:hypothetical protein